MGEVKIIPMEQNQAHRTFYDVLDVGADFIKPAMINILRKTKPAIIAKKSVTFQRTVDLGFLEQ